MIGDRRSQEFALSPSASWPTCRLLSFIRGALSATAHVSLSGSPEAGARGPGDRPARLRSFLFGCRSSW